MKAGNKATVTSLLSLASSLPVPVSASHRAGTSWIQISNPSLRYRQEILSGDEGVWPGRPGRSQCDQFVIKLRHFTIITLKLHTYWKCWCIQSVESSPGTRYLEEKSSVSVVTYIKETTTVLKWTTLHIMLETSPLPCSRPITPRLPNSSSLPLHTAKTQQTQSAALIQSTRTSLIHDASTKDFDPLPPSWSFHFFCRKIHI